MKRFLTALIICLSVAAETPACILEAPTHNAYVFSVFNRESMNSPFAADMNGWWKRYGGEPQSDSYAYYEANRDYLRNIAKLKGDRPMLDYMRMLDAYLEVCGIIRRNSWNYPTKEELVSCDSILHSILKEAQAYKGRHGREQFALMTMRANMQLGRDKANMLYWTATASKLPRGVWREMCRNIYARALLNSGLRRAACEIYARQGDMASIRYCMKNYRNMAGIKKVYADNPDSHTLLYLVQDLVNNFQETLDGDFCIGSNDIRTVETAEAEEFVRFADVVLKEHKTSSPCLWQSAAAMVRYLMKDYKDAITRADAAVSMKGSRRMKDNARCIRLLAHATADPLNSELSIWLTDEFRWLDGKIKEERDNSDEYSNHYTDVKERIAYNVLAPRYSNEGNSYMAFALYGMMEENGLSFETEGAHAEESFIWGGDWPWNKDYAAWNEYFSKLSVCPADSLAAYYTYLTSAKSEVFEYYVAQQVYCSKDFYNDLIGTRYLAEGRFADALPYLERVSLDYLAKQNISWYMANRAYGVPRWFVRQLPNDPETDGPGKATPKENLKVKYCKDMIQLQGSYNLAREGEQKDMWAYELAVRYYQASCYGDCWFLTHYGRSVNDSARAGELDFARKAVEYLDECTKSADLKIRYEALYALAFMSYDPWYTASYDQNYNTVIIPRPASQQYKALAALAKFAKEHPRNVDSYTTKCDVLKVFERSSH